MKNRFLFYNVLVDIVISLLVFPSIVVFLIIGNMAAMVALGIVVVGSIYFVLRIIFMIICGLGFKKMSATQTGAYAAVLVVLAGLTYVAPFIFVLAISPNSAPTADKTRTTDEGVMINGVRWATRNVDAPGTFAESPESFGMFYQWNRKQAWRTRGSRIRNWDNYISTGTKWYAENDPCPTGWRVPTEEELRSLIASGSEAKFQDGFVGYLFGTAPYQILLPAVGRRRDSDGTLEGRGWGSDWGYYWSSSVRNNCAMFMIFASGIRLRTDVGLYRGGRADGKSVRCVAMD